MNKKLLIIPLIFTILGVSGFFISKGYADNENTNLPPFLQNLSKKFNLNENEVITFWNEDRTQRQETMQTQRRQDMTDRLAGLVSAGKLNDSQKNELLAIIEKHQEAMEDFRGKSVEERQQIQQTHRDEVQAWAEKNGLNFDDLELGFFGQGGRGGMGTGMGYSTGRGMGRQMMRDFDDE